jgi:acyl-CoA thioesterase I
MADILWTPSPALRFYRRLGGVGLLVTGLLSTTLACGQGSADDAPLVGRERGSAASTPAPAAAAAAARAVAVKPRPRIVVLGDSLSSGLGLSPTQAFPALLQRKIDAQGLPFEVINAGVSGDTTAGGVRRLDWALDGDVQVLILELGANDGLRGLSVDEMSRNLSQIVERAQARGITVLLCGMEAPPNFGASYTAAFRTAFRDVAGKHRVTLLPFLLEGVAGLPELNQADGIHPNAQGAQRVADTVWGTLRPMLGHRTSSS